MSGCITIHTCVSALSLKCHVFLPLSFPLSTHLSLCSCSLFFQSAWKKQEDKQLMKVAKKHDFCNWALIAADLGVSSNLPFGACPVMFAVSIRCVAVWLEMLSNLHVQNIALIGGSQNSLNVTLSGKMRLLYKSNFL